MIHRTDENVYIFFTKTGKEKEAASDIRKNISESLITPLEYSVEVFFKKRGKIYKEIKPIFPGYLFVTSPMSDEEFILKTRECVKQSRYIIRLLQYDNCGIAAINKEEKEVLESILQGKSCIKTSKGYIKGNKLIITGGPFKGRENLIKSIERHKRHAVVEIPLVGETRGIIVGLEIVNKYLD